jgi:hypothetical protein
MHLIQEDIYNPFCKMYKRISIKHALSSIAYYKLMNQNKEIPCGFKSIRKKQFFLILHAKKQLLNGKAEEIKKTDRN